MKNDDSPQGFVGQCCYRMVSLLIFKTPLIDSEALTWLAYKVSDLKFSQSQLFFTFGVCVQFNGYFLHTVYYHA